MDTYLKLSIIIISYNTEKTTQNCLQSIFNSLKTSPLKYEIIVLDNASSDNSLAMLHSMEKEHSQLKIIENKENVGFAKGNNLAVKQAQGEYILLLNSDTLTLDNAIEKVIQYAETHPNAHFIGGKLLNTDKSPQPSAGPFLTLPVAFLALFMRGDYYGWTRYSPDNIKKVDWVMGACILAKKTYYNEIGGFDEQIFMYMDEVDMLLRAKKAGYSTFFYPEAQFIHIQFGSSGGKKSYPIVQVFKGYVYLYKKHYSSASLFLLKCMLQFKSLIALQIGRITHNQYLITTYEQAYRTIKMA